MSGDALAAGGIVKIDTDLLRDFASMNLQAFLDDVKASPAVKHLMLFAEGGAGGESPNGAYNQVLAGNVEKGSLASAKKLQADFQKFAGLVNDGVVNLHDLAIQMQTDLNMVSTVLESSSDEAELTAAEMSEDLSNLGYGSSSGSSTGSTGSTGTTDTKTTTTSGT
ncbi:hypothetical protein KIH74_35225 [Kineosporia sp. J2-2]|uniref:Type VII secretion system-associated protein n=1 Tax=Kineosporia corallincola TaxID=2835133 RepID=A0ABS5TU26_9ACTN|nr:hypothetical protein [Kineosporia corallincola]MBT0774249.1 hypothetical protein [Kineosporia corallincola]